MLNSEDQLNHPFIVYSRLHHYKNERERSKYPNQQFKSSMPDVPLAVRSAMDGATLLGFPLWLPRLFPFPELVRYYFLSFLSCRQLQVLGTEVQYAREVSSASYHQGDAACFCTLSAKLKLLMESVSLWIIQFINFFFIWLNGLFGFFSPFSNAQFPSKTVLKRKLLFCVMIKKLPFSQFHHFSAALVVHQRRRNAYPRCFFSYISN